MLESFYINKKKQELFSTHNKVFIKDEEFTFEENFLVIDLGQNTNEAPFWLLKLYSDQIRKLKLIKYHTTENCVIFFFLHRENDKGGVHFFIIDLIANIKSKISANLKLIDNSTKIFVPIQLNNIDECTYKDIDSYLGNSKPFL